jgi:hypothetical protein
MIFFEMLAFGLIFLALPMIGMQKGPYNWNLGQGIRICIGFICLAFCHLLVYYGHRWVGRGLGLFGVAIAIANLFIILKSGLSAAKKSGFVEPPIIESPKL